MVELCGVSVQGKLKLLKSFTIIFWSLPHVSLTAIVHLVAELESVYDLLYHRFLL